MNPKTSIDTLLKHLVKTAIMLFLFIIFQFFLGLLPFVQNLTIGGTPITALDLASTVLSVLSIIIIMRFASNAEPVIDELLVHIPKSGRLARLIIVTLMVVFSYYAFQSVTWPFIQGWEWAYHLLFLLFVVILLTVIGSHVYNTSEEISSFFISLLQRKKDEKPAS